MPERDPSSDPNEVLLVEDVTGHGRVAFEPRRVAGGPSRGSVAAWAIAVAALIAIGVGGQHRVGPQTARALVVVPSSGDASGAPDPTDPAPSATAGGVDAIVLRSPGWGPVTVTSHRLYVDGILNVRAVEVEVSLEARGARTVASEHVALPTVGDGVRPDGSPAFSAWFDLPNPRPNGTMWVTVTAYGPDGIPVAGVRQPFLVGPLLEAGAAAPP